MNTADSEDGRRTLSSLAAHEEFTAALEASTGTAQPIFLGDPMSPSGVLEGYHRLLLSPRPDRGLAVLARTGVLASTLPEVAALIGFGDAVRHKDVWAHTLQVVRQTPPRSGCRFGALFHDIGKVPTRRFADNGEVTFLGHPEVGARMFDRIARRLPFPEPAKERIRFLIAAHLRASAWQSDWTDAAVRRFIRDAGPHLRDLLDLARADITSKYDDRVRRGLRQINGLAARILDVRAMDGKPRALPPGLGDTLMREFQIPPGPRLGRLMRTLCAEVEAGTLAPGADHRVYTDHLTRHPSLLADA
jgi:poly(A) polymerase